MEIILSFVEVAAKIIFKVIFTALVKYVVSRVTIGEKDEAKASHAEKERTAPISSRDGSDIST